MKKLLFAVLAVSGVLPALAQNTAIAPAAAADASGWRNTDENPHWKNVLKGLMNMETGMHFMQYPTRLDDHKAGTAWSAHIWKQGQRFHRDFPGNPHWKEWFLFTARHRPHFYTGVTEESLETHAKAFSRTPLPEKYDMTVGCWTLDEPAEAEFMKTYEALRKEFVSTATREEIAALRVYEMQPKDADFLVPTGIVAKALRASASDEERARTRREVDLRREKFEAEMIEIASLPVDWTAMHSERVERMLVGLCSGFSQKSARWFSDYVQGSERERSYWKTLADSSTSAAVRKVARGQSLIFDLASEPFNLDFTAIDGRSMSMVDMKGKVVLVQYWATNCVGCVQEVPWLKSMHEKYHKDGLQILGLSSDDDKDAVTRFIAKAQMDWPQRVDRGESKREAERFGFTGVSNFMLFDKNRRLLAYADAGGNHAEFERLIREQLGLPRT